ncbi:hypothetical protein CC78DRAFT_286255 [Lojkania enalia]|uniref:Uncharacterized protein n=1 Tax=Lojkania enalia TaxID=147567 RepID=A0A9P4MZ02_9PLEO|nr:hypothetical protein CC78DRAFT_286255 [Didymosphaeria enalia]
MLLGTRIYWTLPSSRRSPVFCFDSERSTSLPCYQVTSRLFACNPSLRLQAELPTTPGPPPANCPELNRRPHLSACHCANRALPRCTPSPPSPPPPLSPAV